MEWLLTTISLVLFIHLFFVIAQFKQDNSIMTFAWPLGLLVIATVNYLSVSTPTTTQTILYIIVSIWGIRLFMYTFKRNLRRGYEDFRYRQVRENARRGFLIQSYFQFFIIQGIFMVIVGLPFLGAFSGNYSQEPILLAIGLLVFSVGFAIETVADMQLQRFKQSGGDEEVLSSGLWGYSRHPNYFGEILSWWGMGIIAFSVSQWWVLISPLVVTLLLRYVSGVPMIEERYEDNEDYQKYIENVNPLFPFI